MGGCVTLSAHMWGVKGKFTFGNNVLYGEFDPPDIVGTDKFLGWLDECDFGVQDFIITYGPIVEFPWDDQNTFGTFVPDIKGE